MIPAIVMPAMVGLSRVYRGEHHPTDILASLLFTALWLTATTLLIRPNEDGRDRAHRTSAGRRREPSGRVPRSPRPAGTAGAAR